MSDDYEHPDILPPAEPRYAYQVLYREGNYIYYRVGNDVRSSNAGGRLTLYCPFRLWEQSTAYKRMQNPLKRRRDPYAKAVDTVGDLMDM